MYYLVAYGNSQRVERAKTPQEAMRQAFGLVDENRMTLIATRRKPFTLNGSSLRELQRRLALRHFSRTGVALSGWEREPGIVNVHRAECLLCCIPILTEPAAAGSDGSYCSVYCTKITAADAGLSTVERREKLGVRVHRSPCCEEW